MYPIGIVTYNRAVYLDTTLRSLSATKIPLHVPVIVYDDASNDTLTRAYLDSTAALPIKHRWPSSLQWRRMGLEFLEDSLVLHGIAGKVEIERLGAEPLGVGNASCLAIENLFRRNPTCDGVILLQDDVVFNADWYERLTAQAGRLFKRGSQQGMVAGMHLDSVDIGTRGHKILHNTLVRFASAQCYLVRRAFFENQRAWFARKDHERTNFDRNLCQLAGASGYEVQLVVPYVCQHIGVKSEVRPTLNFYRDEASLGRIGQRARPPYMMANHVWNFKSSSVEVAAC